MSQIDIVPAYFPTNRQLVARALSAKNFSSAEGRYTRDARVRQYNRGDKRLAATLSHIERTTSLSRGDACALYGLAAKLVRSMTGKYVNGLKPVASRGLPSNLRHLPDDSLVDMLSWIMKEYMIEQRNTWFSDFDVKLSGNTFTLELEILSEPVIVRELTWDGRFVHVVDLS